MINFTFLIFGLVDIIAGIIIIFSSGLILGDLAKYVGIVLIGKGIWTVVTSIIKS